MRVGIIGFGYWGPNQVRNFVALQSQGVTVVGVADQSADRRFHARQMFPDVPIVEDGDELIDDPSIDSLVIATPPQTHYRLARKALLAGKHLLIEKPMTTNVADAEDLTQLAEEQGLTLMVGHTYEFSPAVQKIRDLIDAGEIGNVLHIRSERVNLGQHQTNINVVWDLAPHDISIIASLLGRTPTHVRAIGRCHVNPNVEDIASLTLEFEDDVMASVELSWLDPLKSRQMTVIGSKKMLVFDDAATTEKVRVFDKGAYGPDEYRSFGEFQVTYRYGDIVSPVLGNAEPLREQSEHFVDCIRAGKAPRTDGKSGIRVVRALAAAQLSLDEGGGRVSLDDSRLDTVQGALSGSDGTLA